MEKKDFFANIAMELHPENKKELAVSFPKEYNDSIFSLSGKSCERVEEVSFEDKLELFGKDLNDLRMQYKPFLSDFTPKSDISRKQCELKDFQFRYECDEDKNDISYVVNGFGEWESVSLPDYRGPVGKWTGYYRTVLRYERQIQERRCF